MVQRESRSSTIGHITLGMKQTGAPSAGNPHAGCDVAGAGNGFTVWLLRHSQRKRGETDRPDLRNTAPVFDPTPSRNVWSAAALQAKNENDMVGLRECIRPLCELVLWPWMECAALLSYLVTQAFKAFPGYRFQECRVRPLCHRHGSPANLAGKSNISYQSPLVCDCGNRECDFQAWRLSPGVNCRPVVSSCGKFQSKVEVDRLLLWRALPRPCAPSCWPGQPPPPECACGR